MLLRESGVAVKKGSGVNYGLGIANKTVVDHDNMGGGVGGGVTYKKRHGSARNTNKRCNIFRSDQVVVWDHCFVYFIRDLVITAGVMVKFI